MIKIFLLLSLIAFVWGIRDKDYFEGSCPTRPDDYVFITKALKGADWLKSHADKKKYFYLTMCSKLDVTRLTQNLYHSFDLSSLTWQDVQNNCIYATMDKFDDDGMTIHFHGYCGWKFSKRVIAHEDFTGIFKWKSKLDPGNEYARDAGYFALSLVYPNEFTIINVCWGDGQKSFAVISATPYLSHSDIELIEYHQASVGYNSDYFFYNDYSNCGNICRPAIYKKGGGGDYDHGNSDYGYKFYPY